MRATTLLRATTVAVLLALSVASPAAALPGELDASFDGDGKRVWENVGLDIAYDVLIQPDGKIVVVGASSKGTADFAVARLHTDGRLDTSFDDNGITFLDFGGSDQAYAVALQEDGRIVVAGSTSAGGGNGAVARLRPNGTLDASFAAGDADGDGKRTIEYFGPAGADRSRDVVVQPDGKIVVAGEGGPYTALAVTRLLPNGTDDISFDGDGIAGADAGGAESGRAVALQGDGRIVVAGIAISSEAAVLVARFNPAGPADMTRDTSFGPYGLGWTAFRFGGVDRATGVLVQGDGKLVVTGSGGASTALAAARLNPGGRDFDTSFDGNGTALADFEGDETGSAGLLQPDGKIIVVGSTTSNYDIAVARFNATGPVDGTLDASFGSGGRTTIDAGGFDYGWGAALQADGKIVIAGETDRGAVVARLQGDPVPDPGRGGPGHDPAPHISRLSLTPARFAATGRRRGTRIRFTLSEAADVIMTIERARSGRRVRGSCPVRSNRRARRCTLWRHAGRMRHVGREGANTMRFSGRIRGRPLTRGPYRLRLIAVDAANQRSQPRLARFTVRGARRHQSGTHGRWK